MARNKSSISKASSYREMGEFWVTHDLTDYWEQTYPVDFVVDLQSEETYYPVDAKLSNRIHALAKRRGVSPETLLNIWLQEKIQAEAA